MKKERRSKSLISGMAMWSNRSKSLSLSFLLFACVGASGQTISDVEQNIRATYPDRSAVFVEQSATLTLSIEGDSLKAYSDMFDDIIFLKDVPDSYSKGRIYGSHFSRIENIKAKTLVWEKNRYRELPVTDFKRNSDVGDNVFYDDRYYISFNYPAVAAGNRTQLRYRDIDKEIRFLSGYIFSSFIPVKKSIYTIKTPKDVDLHYELHNDPNKLIKFTKTEKGDNVVYQWVMENVEQYKVEDDSPSIRYYEPHLVCYVKSFKGKSGVHPVLADATALHKWYYSMIEEVSKEPSSDEMKRVVADIKSKYSSEEDIVKAVFYWVQSNIHYIAIEDGMLGFIPDKPSFICEKKYGDCKGMATLIVALLKEAGIKAHPTWIGTRDLPYTYEQVPTPLSDNHMIATYISPKGRYYFLDATGSYIPFGFPTGMIQGKQGLISFGPDKFEVREVPAVNKTENLITDSLSLTLNNNTLVGSGQTVLRGLTKSSASNYLDRVEQKKIHDFVSTLVGKGSNKFLLDKYDIENSADYDKPTVMRYEFTISDYCQRVGDEVYINLNLNKDNQNRVINEQLRKTPHEFDFKYMKIEKVAFKIPEGYEVEYLPENESYDGKLMGCTVKYEVKGDVIHYYKSHYVDYLLMRPEQFGTWNQDVTKISRMYQETVILKKKK
jgi:transglutaminase-like putative cysteine protease